MPSRYLLFLICVAFLRIAPGASVPEVAELSFDSGYVRPDALAAAKAPAWVTKVEQLGGRFLDEPKCWRVEATQPQGVGRLSISLDRRQMTQNLVATILFDAEAGSDLAVQLFDGQGRVVVLDVFGNLVDVGKEAKTDTVVIPLRKYPTAEKIVLRRVAGGVSVYGVVLFPVMGEGVPDNEALKELASVLGDPLSPENPLLKGLQQIAKNGKVSIGVAKPTVPLAVTPSGPAAATVEPPRGKYAAAVPLPAGLIASPPPTDGLVAWWNFNDGTAIDASGHHHDGKIRGGAQGVPGGHGKALKFRRNPSAPRATIWDSVIIPTSDDLALKETLTVAAWIKYSSIAENWGSVIAWFGDTQLGRDPWQLHLLPDGTLEFRSDRSVSGQPKFTIFENEIHLSSEGTPMLNQHVSVWSPDLLQPQTWYFVAATVEKVSPGLSAFKLFVNGDLVGEVKTDETVNYPTTNMWATIGGVDLGDWQNFAGEIDDVRIYNRPLSPAEIKVLYHQPWK